MCIRDRDKEWLCCLYGYLGDMYIHKYNMLKFINYQTLANQCIKDIASVSYTHLYKRLEGGSFALPTFNPHTGKYEISYQVLSFILNGVSLKSVRWRKRFRI